MQKNFSVLNTIAFLDKLENGKKQSGLIEKVAELGFDAIEIRSEFLSDKKSDILNIKTRAKENKLNIYFSVNDTLINEKNINSKLSVYFDTAIRLGASHIKFNLGNFSLYKGDLNKDLSPYLKNEIKINVENNQTPDESDLSDFVKFFNLVERNSIDIGFCFDIANWYWTSTTPEKAANLLSKYTKYLHLKNVIFIEGQPIVTSLQSGNIDWKALLKKFDNNLPFALEYPGEEKQISSDLAAIKSYRFNTQV